MKPGPYQSTVYGDIPLSLAARSLLVSERDAVVGLREAERRDANATANTPQLAIAWQKSRGDIARYVSRLEAEIGIGPEFAEGSIMPSQAERWRRMYECAPPPAGISYEDLLDPFRELAKLSYSTARSVLRNFGGAEKLTRVKAHRLAPLLGAVRHELAALQRPGRIVMQDFSQIEARVAAYIYQEMKMNDQTQTTETTKTRAQIVNEAGSELSAATQALENLRTRISKFADNKEVESVSVSISPGLYTTGHAELVKGVAELVKERFDDLRDEVLYRAELRVYEAEAAMTRLLGGEPSEAKPKRKRAKAK